MLPTYNQQSSVPFSGASATMVGVKHEFNSGQNWVTSGDILITPPSGSMEFGSKGFGMVVNGIAAYQINPKTSMTLFVGWSSTTLPGIAGGERFNSVNPSLVLSYAVMDTLNVFAEVFAQTTTAPGIGANYNADCGLLYLLTPDVVLDFEVAQQLGHEAGSCNQYIGSGVTIKF